MCEKRDIRMPGTGKFWIPTHTIYQFDVRWTSGSRTEVLLLCNGHRSAMIQTGQYFLYTVRRTSASRFFFSHCISRFRLIISEQKFTGHLLLLIQSESNRAMKWTYLDFSATQHSQNSIFQLHAAVLSLNYVKAWATKKFCQASLSQLRQPPEH